jgi:hypothetical protein
MQQWNWPIGQFFLHAEDCGVIIKNNNIGAS